MIGVDPAPFTLRQLGWMFDERQKHRWDCIAEIVSVMLNVNGGDARASELNPYRQSERVVLDEADSMEMLKRVFVKGDGEK